MGFCKNCVNYAPIDIRGGYCKKWAIYPYAKHRFGCFEEKSYIKPELWNRRGETKNERL